MQVRRLAAAHRQLTAHYLTPTIGETPDAAPEALPLGCAGRRRTWKSLTRNQVELMQIDTTASDNLPGFRALSISPRSLEEELEAMLKQSN